MTSQPSNTGGTVEPKLLGSTRLKIRLALASSLVLVAGALLAPRAVPRALTAPEERAAPLLEAEVQRRGQAQLFRGVQDIGPRVVAHSVAIPRLEEPRPSVVLDFVPPTANSSTPAGFGLVVSSRDVLTHASALEGRSTVQIQASDGIFAEARATAYDPATGLVLLAISGPSALTPAPAAGERPKPGALAAAVAHWAGSELVTPLFVTGVDSDAYTTSVGAVPVLAGTPIYNLDGEVLAVAAGPARNGAAFPVMDALVRLRERAAAGKGRPASLGVALQPLVGALARAFGETGALVSDVIRDGPADRAGVQPGDVLLAVGQTGVESVETAQQVIGTLEAGAQASVRVRRGARERVFEVNVGEALDLAAAGQLARTDRSDAAPAARELFPLTELRAANVPADARVLTLNGRQITSRDEALGLIRRTRPPRLLRLQHNGQRFFARLEELP